MAGLATIRPNLSAAVGTGWTNVGGAANIPAAMADGSVSVPNDSTYAENTTTFSKLWVGLQNPTIPAGPLRITGVRISLWGWRGVDVNLLRATTVLDGFVDGDTDNFVVGQGVGGEVFRLGKIRTRDPRGALWTRDRINDLQIQLNATGAHGVAVAELFVDVTWALAPTINVTTPTGTQGTTRPQGEVVYDQEDGYPQSRIQHKVFAASVFNGAGFDPDTSPAVYDSEELSTGLGTHTPPVDILNGTYRWYSRAACTVVGSLLWSLWDYSDFVVLLDQPSAPVLQVVPESSNGRVKLLLTGTDNMLGRQEADLEATGVGYMTGAFGNCTVARSTAQQNHGSASLAMTATGAGDMLAYPNYQLAVVEGRIYEWLAAFRAAATARSCELIIRWLDGALAQIGADVVGGTTADTTSGWTAIGMTGAAPTGAVYAQPLVRVKSAAASEVHYVDTLKFAPLLATWTRGGLVNRNLLSANQGSVETDTTGFQVRSNCTIAQSAAQAVEGTKSLALTAVAAGNMSAQTLEGVDGIPVVAGNAYTALCSFRSASTARATHVGITFYDADGNVIQTTLSGPTNDSNAAWTALSVTRTAPAGAAFAAVAGYIDAAGVSEVHYLDRLSLSPNPSTLWFPGGTIVTTTPTVEFSDAPVDVADVDAAWFPVRGTVGLQLDGGQGATIYDNEAPPALRRYRAAITAVDAGVVLAGPPSGTSFVTLAVDQWWFKDPKHPELNVGGLAVYGPIATKIAEETGVFQELADPNSPDPVFPSVTSGGITGEHGTYKCTVRTEEQWAALRALLAATRTLLLVSPYGWQRYIRIPNDRDIALTGALGAPRREISFYALQSARPA
jgi:hypothetical protein